MPVVGATCERLKAGHLLIIQCSTEREQLVVSEAHRNRPEKIGDIHDSMTFRINVFAYAQNGFFPIVAASRSLSVALVRQRTPDADRSHAHREICSADLMRAQEHKVMSSLLRDASTTRLTLSVAPVNASRESDSHNPTVRANAHALLRIV